MEQVIKALLSESGYSEQENGITFYSKDEQSFFFITSISEENFQTFRSKDSLKDNEQYTTTLNGFKAIVNGGDQIAIEKNSSLIVMVKCSGIGQLESLQQQILLLEEDPYFFKKYVILYTDSSISKLLETPIIPEIKNIVNNDQNFTQFSKVGFKSELEEFIVAIQLFVKLPFLKFDASTENFTQLGEKIGNALGSDGSMYSALLENSEDLLTVDFLNAEEEAVIKLLNSLSDD